VLELCLQESSVDRLKIGCTLLRRRSLATDGSCVGSCRSIALRRQRRLRWLRQLSHARRRRWSPSLRTLTLTTSRLDQCRELLQELRSNRLAPGSACGPLLFGDGWPPTTKDPAATECAGSIGASNLGAIAFAIASP